MPNLIGRKGEEALAKIGFEMQMISMGHQSCGALELGTILHGSETLYPKTWMDKIGLIVWTLRLLKVVITKLDHLYNQHR